MSVQSHLFVLAFLPAVLLLWRLGRRLGERWPRVLLLGAGVLFCGWSAPLSLLVLLAEGVASYLLGRRIIRAGAHKKGLLIAGAAGLLAVLAWFKYTGFVLSLTPWEGLFAPPGWLAPLGLSFVTFQQIFWLRDCYDGRVEKVSPLDYGCCLTFFATVTCGPITRVEELAPQFRRPAPFSWDGLAAGLYCFSLGLAKKVLLAGIFANGADFGFARAGTLSPMDSALTILCYTLQIYFDFSGYCDMASGMAGMMGISLPVNFNSPYRALSIQDFWGRWHITLSRFFRQCVYIPLGGSRRGMWITCRNIMTIFLLSGLWHGAGWRFLIWGGLHGIAMVIQRLWGDRKFLPKPMTWLFTFLFVNFAWVFFRAPSVKDGVELLKSIVSFQGGRVNRELAACFNLDEFWYVIKVLGIDGWQYAYEICMVWILAGAVLLVFFGRTAGDHVKRAKPKVIHGVVMAALFLWSVLSLTGVSSFLYVNF